MKNFNKKIYALNLQSIKYIDSPIPSEYWKLAFNIANSFSKEYAAIGVLNINDLMQEGYLALFKTWKKIDWKYIDSLENQIDKNKAINKYLSISIKGLIGDEIKKNADGTAKPIKGIWNNEDRKRHTSGFGFVSILFPHWFDSNVLAVIEDEVYDYDYEKLGDYLLGWLNKYIPKYSGMMQMFFGLDDVYSKPKKMSYIAKFYSSSVGSVKKQKQRLLIKLRRNDLALDELSHFVVTNGIKSSSKVYDYAEIKLKIYKD